MIQPFRTYPTTARPARVQPSRKHDSLTQVFDHLLDRATPRDERAIGDYLIGYSIQAAEGVYHLIDGELVWNSPTDENIHLVISVRDALDGRFLPSVTVHATLLDSEGREIDTRQQPFVWHPWLYDYGYGCNWKVPGSGKYMLRVQVAPNQPQADDASAAPVVITFRKVKITVNKPA